MCEKEREREGKIETDIKKMGKGSVVKMLEREMER